MRQEKRMWYANAGPSMTTLSANSAQAAYGLSAAVRPRIPILHRSNHHASREQRLGGECLEILASLSARDDDDGFNHGILYARADALLEWLGC